MKLLLPFYLALQIPLIAAETYSDSATWSGRGQMVLTEEKLFGFSKEITWDVSVSGRSTRVGERLSVRKNGKVVKSFIVRRIAKGKNGDGVPSCWVSWLDQNRFPSYLSITNCR